MNKFLQNATSKPVVVFWHFHLRDSQMENKTIPEGKSVRCNETEICDGMMEK